MSIEITKQTITAAPRQLDAAWEVELEDILAEEISREIDDELINQFTVEILKEEGWVSVTVNPEYRDPESREKIKEWVVLNCSPGVHNFGNNWLFENPKDVTIFTLRWV